MNVAPPDYPHYPKAVERILGAVDLPTVEMAGIHQALGRVLAADIQVPCDFPDHPCSAVDGYAFRSGNGSNFKVVMEVAAGHLPDRKLEPGQAAAVMTGGVLPEETEGVVRLEDCVRAGDQLEIRVDAAPGALVNSPGSEAKAGDELATAGARLGVAGQGALLCAGVGEVPVYRLPRVGIMATGDELCEIGPPRPPGQVFNTNQYLVESICRSLGVPYESVPSVKDNPTEISRVLDDLCLRCDFVVTSGGVSVGSRDFVHATLEDPRFELLVAGTRIKPGRPLHVARQGRTLVFALPGYPAAALVNALLYLVPALKKACGRRRHQTIWLWGETGDSFRGRPGTQYLARASLTVEKGKLVARDPGSQMSSHFLNFARTDALVRLPLEPPFGRVQADGSFVLPAGTPVEVLNFDLELI